MSDAKKNWPFFTDDSAERMEELKRSPWRPAPGSNSYKILSQLGAGGMANRILRGLKP